MYPEMHRCLVAVVDVKRGVKKVFVNSPTDLDKGQRDQLPVIPFICKRCRAQAAINHSAICVRDPVALQLNQSVRAAHLLATLETEFDD